MEELTGASKPEYYTTDDRDPIFTEPPPGASVPPVPQPAIVDPSVSSPVLVDADTYRALSAPTAALAPRRESGSLIAWLVVGAFVVWAWSDSE